MDLREITDHPIRRHPWETARANYFRAVLMAVSGCGIDSVLDVGAGDGWLSRELHQLFPGARLTCWDSGYGDDYCPITDNSQDDSVSYTKNRPEDRHDLILLLDVLEHLDNDGDFLRSLVNRNAEQDAFFLVCTPAWNFLYSSHDATFTHRRRYSPAELSALVRAAGLEVLRDGDMFQSLLVPRLLRVAREVAAGTTRTKGQPQPLKWPHGELLARLIELHLSAESKIFFSLSRMGIKLPGLSTWVLCRKR